MAVQPHVLEGGKGGWKEKWLHLAPGDNQRRDQNCYMIHACKVDEEKTMATLPVPF